MSEESHLRAVVTNPPHATDIEAAFGKELESMVDRGEAFALERIKQANANLDKLSKHLALTSRRARLVLKAHHETVKTVRIQSEEITRVCEELTAGHQRMLELLDKA